MSGPKVVRVVTREELIDNCTALLRQLDRMIAKWIREGQRLGSLAADEVDSVQKRREALAAYLREDQFALMQRQIPEEIAFLTSDLEQRRESAAQIAAQAMQQRRQERQNAAVLIKELKLRSHPVQQDLLSQLELIASGAIGGDHVEAILANGYAQLSQPAAPGLTENQRNLARQLAPNDDGMTYEEWRRSQGHRDIRLKQIDQHLAQLQTYLGKDAAEEFANRLQAIEAETFGPTTNMRIDAIILDLGTAVRTLKSHRELIQEARDLVAELDLNDSIDSDTTNVSSALLTAISSEDVARLPSLMEAGHGLIAARKQHKAAEARRAAILSGLSALGYEVREGMSTVWTDKGRIVIGKPSLPGYGVELAGTADLARLQVRAVAFEPDRDTTRDRDVETIWCNDFGKLREMVAEQGGGIAIEQSLAVGATPLKIVDMQPEVRGHEDDRNVGRKF